MFRPAAAGAIALLLTIAPLGGREPVNDDINARIRKEGRENSQVLRTMHYLTDVYGPRLTGSPNHKAAAEWAIKQMTEWGLTNGRLEPWDFGHAGWLNERFSGFIVSPAKDSLVGEVVAWTPSTNGVVTADAVQIVPPDRPTEEDMSRWATETAPKVKGRIVLVGRHTIVPVNFNKAALRRDDETLRRQYQPDSGPAPQNPQGKGRGGRGNAATVPQPGQLGATMVAERVDAMVVAAGALVRINDAGRDHGQIRAFNNRTFDLAKAVPTVVLRNEDYGRISRILGDGTQVRLEFNIVNRLRRSPATSTSIPAPAGSEAPVCLVPTRPPPCSGKRSRRLRTSA